MARLVIRTACPNPSENRSPTNKRVFLASSISSYGLFEVCVCVCGLHVIYLTTSPSSISSTAHTDIDCYTATFTALLPAGPVPTAKQAEIIGEVCEETKIFSMSFFFNKIYNIEYIYLQHLYVALIQLQDLKEESLSFSLLLSLPHSLSLSRSNDESNAARNGAWSVTLLDRLSPVNKGAHQSLAAYPLYLCVGAPPPGVDSPGCSHVA